MDEDRLPLQITTKSLIKIQERLRRLRRLGPRMHPRRRRRAHRAITLSIPRVYPREARPVRDVSTSCIAVLAHECLRGGEFAYLERAGPLLTPLDEHDEEDEESEADEAADDATGESGGVGGGGLGSGGRGCLSGSGGGRGEGRGFGQGSGGGGVRAAQGVGGPFTLTVR